MKCTYVPPRGPIDAKLAVCGEQPGVQEIRFRPPTPFVGPAGQAQDNCMLMAGIDRHDCYLTNVIKDLDAPLSHYINLDSRGKYTISEEGWAYINELKEELSALKNLNAIIAYGNVALIALTNRVGITKWRGSIIESTLIPRLKVIPTFHPATFIPPKFNFLNKPLICFDLKRAKYESGFPELRREERNVKIRPTYQEAVAELKYAYYKGLHGSIIDIDIEVINEELDCIAIASSPNESISIPFRGPQGDYFSIEQEYEIMLLISAIIQEEKISIRGANFIFDCQFLFHKYGIVPRGEIHCTQIAQKITFPDFRAGLDFVTTMHTDIPYYKEDGKKWMKIGGSWDTWWTYNGMDALSTAAAHPNQLNDLESQDNLETYNRQRKLIKPLICMSEKGISIDVEEMMKERDSISKSIEEKTEELNTIVGFEINHNSPKQLMEYFYNKLHLKPYKKRNTKGQWVETADEDAMKRLARKGYKEARIILDLRRANKRLSTYLNIGKIDTDGRYRSSYKPVGTETGRISSGETIFGTGGNQQNWPHSLLRFFLFDEGYIGYSFDLSQIENRIVAYVGGIISMIEAFETGKDLHRLTASMIFGKPYDEISDEDGSCTLGDGLQSERFWGKKGNHAINYDFGYKSFALKYEITEKEAEHIINAIHRAYPEIRQNYHALIQNMLKENRTVVNLFGRKRLFMGPVVPNSPKSPLAACIATYREGYAQLPQSTTADKINEQGVEYIYYNQEEFSPIELLTQVHDSVVFQIPLSIPWKQQADMLIKIKKSLESPIYWRDIKIPTPADLSIGFNMCKEEMKELKSKNIPNDIDELSNKLQEVYSSLMEKKGI
jgi:uracil-DNA glycosylase family 4